VPRAKRLDLPGVPQHVIQRGNDRQPCFFRNTDYLRYLQDLRDAAFKFGCRIHAYVLMSNHVHLLVTPEQAGGIGRMMQAIGRRYVRYINGTRGRTGTLWEGRYKACLVDSERYVLTCYRYIELNPVRAAMVTDPDQHRWSSYRHNALGRFDPVVSPHPVYLQLDCNDECRLARYRELVASGLSIEELEAIRLYAKRQRALGDARFQAEVEQRLQQRAGLGVPGRPRRGMGEKLL